MDPCGSTRPGKRRQAGGPRQHGAAAGIDRPGPDRVYGRNPTREVLRGSREVRRIWVAGGPSHGSVVRDLEQAAREGGRRSLPPFERADDCQLAELAGSDDHQGVVAEVGPYRYTDAEVLLAEEQLVLVLDRIQDPHNLGAIVRTAEEAGAAVVVPRHRAAGVTPAVVRASAGATEHARVAQVRNLSDFLSDARDRGFWVYGAEAGAAVAYSVPDYRGKVALVVGSEGAGLAPRVRAGCDQLVYIPLAGRVGSLNVSVAAGIFLFEVVRQRAAASLTAIPASAEPVLETGGARSHPGEQGRP